ncbi:GAF domain-containing protein [Kallotenue papyrolyticum]|uniref:GAF domain-containing protein n=1 Tax=Kallotenue papyrolyticum TaxID=1325125 RepID=UPI000492419F|nr:GAF domain-containing protein [Kallotenue papyrolyticum]
MLTSALPGIDHTLSLHRPALDEIIDGLLHVIAQLLNPRLTAIARIETPLYTIMAAVDRKHQIRAGQTYPLTHTFCLYMLERERPLRINDVAQANLPLRSIPTRLDLPLHAYLGVPLLLHDGRVFGSLWVADDQPRAWSASDVGLLELIARLLTHELSRDALLRHQERVTQSSRGQSTPDTLTGLPAWNELRRFLSPTSRRSAPALAVIALEPALGSEHLTPLARQELAGLLMRTARMVDWCARADDDLFVVLFPDGEGMSAWQLRMTTALRLWNRIHAPQHLALHAYIGIADWHEVADEPDPLSALLELARSRVREQVPGALR